MRPSSFAARRLLCAKSAAIVVGFYYLNLRRPATFIYRHRAFDLGEGEFEHVIGLVEQLLALLILPFPQSLGALRISFEPEVGCPRKPSGSMRLEREAGGVPPPTALRSVF
jgi:hypothetical protein